ncbi:protein FAM32A [Geosmithia morbida]|uniref:Protein FAM32A n=1 Tax=Geosmithia morbida TaxID=1094350 RepID=A0A9P4YT83_9HYPO|nr:protein FAM32A [Geosmithia morbida]KAF4120584.1 protein FAM32A [Geosmithia morbida]
MSDLSGVVGGKLRLKGVKVEKKKKKKKGKDADKKKDLEKNLSTGDDQNRERDDDHDDHDDDHDDVGNDHHQPIKTEAELRYEETRKKRLLKMAETSRPELLKTHKERVEELNTYLSKLSEHHDMPKIGPG